MGKPMGKPTVDDKIILSIERLTSVFRLLLWDIAKTKKLSPIQIQFLLYLRRQPKNRRTVSQLAREFGLTKATVSDAVRVLNEKGLVSRVQSPKDGRVQTLNLTSAGRRLALKLGDWPLAVKERLKGFSPEVKEAAMVFLMELIASLHDAGIIEAVGMCTSCANFRMNAGTGSSKPHFCVLTSSAIADSDLKFDCNSHECG